jgi:hypothetical protein
MNNKIAVKPLSRLTIRNRAKALRLLCGLGDGVIDVLRFLEHIMPQLFPDLSIEILDEFEGENGKCGEFDFLADAIRVPRERYDKACEGDGRARFDIIHECMHKILLTPEDLAFCRYSREIKPFEDPEWQADCFAGEFLMPAEQIKGLSKDDVAAKYGVTKAAARTQLSKL